MKCRQIGLVTASALCFALFPAYKIIFSYNMIAETCLVRDGQKTPLRWNDQAEMDQILKDPNVTNAVPRLQVVINACWYPTATALLMIPLVCCVRSGFGMECSARCKWLCDHFVYIILGVQMAIQGSWIALAAATYFNGNIQVCIGQQLALNGVDIDAPYATVIPYYSTLKGKVVRQLLISSVIPYVLAFLMLVYRLIMCIVGCRSGPSRYEEYPMYDDFEQQRYSSMYVQQYDRTVSYNQEIQQETQNLAKVKDSHSVQ